MDIDNIKVDILLATYNGEKYIREQLDSLINQTHSNFNLIIQDDCSKDNTVEILKKYVQKDNRISFNINKENIGYIKNFEGLLNRVDSEYFMLCDQDDVWLPEKIEVSLKKIMETNSDLVFTDLQVVDESLSPMMSSLIRHSNTLKNILVYNDYRLIYLRNCVTGCTILTKKKFICKFIPIPIKFPMIHDWWMTLIVGLNGKIQYIDRPLIKYRQHGKNQVGIIGMKNYIQDFYEYREKYIDLKLNQFNIYKENDNIFNEELKKLNIDAIEYYENIKNKKYLNFKMMNTFFRLYKMEYLGMRLKTHLLLNIPIIGKPFFELRRVITELKK